MSGEVLVPNLALALLALVPLVAVELAKVARWQALFGPRRPSYLRCLRALVAGQVANALVPIRAGEVVGVGVLVAQGGALVPAAASLAGSKAIDSVSLAAIAAAVVGAVALSHAGWGLAAGGALLAAAVALALAGPRARAWLERRERLRRLRLGALVDVAETLRDRRLLGLVLLATAVVWGGGLLANAVVLAAVGLPPTVDLAARMLVAGYLVGLVPAPPARIGVFEAGVALALTSAGVAPTQAVIVGLTLHVAQLVELGLLLAVGLLASRRAWASP